MANLVEEAVVRAVVSLYFAQYPPAFEYTVFATMDK